MNKRQKKKQLKRFKQIYSLDNDDISVIIRDTFKHGDPIVGHYYIFDNILDYCSPQLPNFITNVPRFKSVGFDYCDKNNFNLSKKEFCDFMNSRKVIPIQFSQVYQRNYIETGFLRWCTGLPDDSMVRKLILGY